MGKRLGLRQSWCIKEKISLDTFSHFLTDAQYEKVKDIESVEVLLYFWRVKPDPETGIPESVDFDEFHIDEKYPAFLREALGNYLNSLDLDSLYREKVLEMVRDFYEREDW